MMCSPLIVFVADRYRTEASCAVLGCLQQVETRRSGRRRPVQFVFNPTGTPEPGLLQGAGGAVLVLLESQKAAAERLVAYWEQLTSQHWSLPVLPVVVRTGGNAAPNNRLPLPIPCAISAVTVYQSDVFVEHGGLLSLSQNAETEIEQALRSVFHSSDASRAVNAPGTCPASRIAGIAA